MTVITVRARPHPRLILVDANNWMAFLAQITSFDEKIQITVKINLSFISEFSLTVTFYLLVAS